MIKYECDMCHKIFDGEDIDEYKMPRYYQYSEIDDVFNKIGVKNQTSAIVPHHTHLCKDCAKKIAKMMDIVVDK